MDFRGLVFLHPIFQFSYILTYARSKSCCINWGETVRFARKCQEKCTMVFIEINWLHFSHLTLNCQNKCTNLWRCHVMSVLSSQVSNAMYAQGESYWSELFKMAYLNWCFESNTKDNKVLDIFTCLWMRFL